jgi:hypothetical protein
MAWPIATFCALHGISTTTAYVEVAAGRLRIAKVGTKTLVTSEAAAEWRRLCEERASIDSKRGRHARRANRTRPTAA